MPLKPATKKRKPLPLFPPAKNLLEVKRRTLKLLRLGRIQGPMAVYPSGRPTNNALGENVCGVCLVGAMIRAAAGESEGLFIRLYDLVGYESGEFTPPAFNDAPGRTAAEVIALVRSVKVPGEGKRS